MGGKKIYEARPITDLKDLLNQSVELFGNKTAFKLKIDNENKIYKEISYSEFGNDVNSLGTALLNLGLKDTTINIISDNRYEWAVSYLAVVNGVGIVAPLDKALTSNEIKSLVERSNSKAVIFSEPYLETMLEIMQEPTCNVKYFICMDNVDNPNIINYSELINTGKKSVENNNKEYINAQINPEKFSILLFTSGTTSQSKAVMLSHKNIVSNVMDCKMFLDVTDEDIVLSFLPLHHTFECTVGFLYPLYRGAKIAFCGGIRHIADDIKDYKVTAMISVPALYENMYRKVMKGLEKSGKAELVDKGMKISSVLMKFGVDMRRKIFSEIHDKFGGELRLFVNGAAPLDKEVEKGFNDLGIKTVQGYGLTETSPVISAGNDFDRRIGSVGKVLPSLKVKIMNKDKDGVGEIAVKGPSIMLGYYNNEEATKEVLKDGWFYTGDLGYFDKDDFLYISGRCKTVIVLKNGKNIFPEEMETLVNRIDGVKESMVYGKPDKDDDVKICVKIVYDSEIMKDTYGLDQNDKIQEHLWAKVKEINKTMPAYKYIREMIITDEELIKTTTQKIKRHEEMKKILN